jgi:hypothetical protein
MKNHKNIWKARNIIQINKRRIKRIRKIIEKNLEKNPKFEKDERHNQ